MRTEPNRQIAKLITDALKVRDYPLDMQEGFLTMIIQQAITYGHTDCIDRLRANGVLGSSPAVKADAPTSIAPRRGFFK